MPFKTPASGRKSMAGIRVLHGDYNSQEIRARTSSRKRGCKMHTILTKSKCMEFTVCQGIMLT